jgi:hypothetical protein
MKSLRRLYAIFIFAAISANAFAQAKTKPYKIFTSGREITIKSSKEIEYVMVWTTEGDRVVEQKELKKNLFVPHFPSIAKHFFDGLFFR